MLHCIALSSLQDELFFLTEEQQHIAYFAYTLMLCTAIQVDDNKPNQTKPASLLLPLPFSLFPSPGQAASYDDAEAFIILSHKFRVWPLQFIC